ncbi:MAG: DUF1573 domain-containing protein [Planctomycetes bacterium]|nr:DUF1573 domain-containing protein [Planctomycetota bacterium]
MRIGFVVLLAIVLGLAVSMASAIAEFGYSQTTPTLAVSALPLSPNIGPASRVVIKDAVHHFGEMYNSDVGRHTFILRNAGPGTLKLGQGLASCACTIANVSRQEIPPGESAEVAVEWRPVGAFGELKKTYTIPTNDPNRQSLVLSVEGMVLSEWRMDPPFLNFQEVGVSETKEVTANLLAYRSDKCEITGHTWENSKLADKLGFAYQAMSAEELAKLKPTPKAGVRLKCVARPGLPVGPLMQRLSLNTTLQKEPIPVPLAGDVSEEVSFIGYNKFDPKKRLLDLGTVVRGTAKESRIAGYRETRQSVGRRFPRIGPDHHRDDAPGLQGVEGSGANGGRGEVVKC